MDLSRLDKIGAGRGHQRDVQGFRTQGAEAGAGGWCAVVGCGASVWQYVLSYYVERRFTGKVRGAIKDSQYKSFLEEEIEAGRMCGHAATRGSEAGRRSCRGFEHVHLELTTIVARKSLGPPYI